MSPWHVFGSLELVAGEVQKYEDDSEEVNTWWMQPLSTPAEAQGKPPCYLRLV